MLKKKFKLQIAKKKKKATLDAIYTCKYQHIFVKKYELWKLYFHN